jgi:hypothetical protein
MRVNILVTTVAEQQTIRRAARSHGYGTAMVQMAGAANDTPGIA